MADRTGGLPFLEGLNDAQMKAVTSSSNGVMQIIAGPGTGKTKVLTSRVAYLLLRHKIPPESIIVTTFTKKAANEMKERLGLMLENTGINVNKLLMGTFHSICLRILKRYGHLINLVGYSVATERDCVQIIEGVIERNKNKLEEMNGLYESGTLPSKQSMDFSRGKQPFNSAKFIAKISSLKSKGFRSTDYLAQNVHNKLLALVFQEYESKLNDLKLWDFDDLLVHVNTLLKTHKCLRYIEHVLIDEFQDTNTVQLELMRGFATQNVYNANNITVVGDPDQSIYAFRDAVATNFAIMRELYPDCRVIKLSENYRSTKHILDFSEGFMRQQKNRVQKKLLPQLPHSFSPVYKDFGTPEQEAEYIADEILFLKSLPGLYKFSDFSILLRAAYLSRFIEKSFVQKRIPYTVLKGRAFWERKEVSLMIDFLRAIGNRNDACAVVRVLRECTSGIGTKGLQIITELIDTKVADGLSPLETLRGVSEGVIPIGGRISKASIKTFLEIIDGALDAFGSDRENVDAIARLFDYFQTLDVFTKLLEGSEERKESLEEVRNQILSFEPPEDDLDIGEGEEALEKPEESLLEKFILSVNLYLISDKENQNNTEGSVTVCTIHASKGLEWPVVFVPGLADSILPSSKATDEESLNEERRILYVSTTRAKHLLYLTYSPRGQDSGPSSFISNANVQMMMVREQTAVLASGSIGKLFAINQIQAPDNQYIADLISKYKDIEANRERSRAAHTSRDMREGLYGIAVLRSKGVVYTNGRATAPKTQDYHGAQTIKKENWLVSGGSRLAKKEVSTFKNESLQVKKAMAVPVKREFAQAGSFHISEQKRYAPSSIPSATASRNVLNKRRRALGMTRPRKAV